jgi:hypothetical protein
MANLRSVNARLRKENRQANADVEKTVADLQCKMMSTLATAFEKRKTLEQQLDEANGTIFELKKELEASKTLRDSLM